MKKIFYINGIIILFILSITGGYYKSKQIRINNENKCNLDYIVDMGVAENMPNTYYYVVNDREDLANLRYSLFYDKVKYENIEFSFVDVLFNKIDKYSYGNRIMTYVDVDSGEISDVVNVCELVNHNNLDLIAPYDLLIEGKHALFYDFYKWNYFTGERSQQRYVLRYDFDTETACIEEITTGNMYGDVFLTQLYENEEVAEKEAMRQHIVTNESFLGNNDLQDRIIAIESGNYLVDFWGYIYILDINDLPKNNSLFDAEFPKILSLANEMSEGYVMIQLPYELSAEDVVKLFSDNCAEISFEGVYIDEHDSIDGLVHYVDSLEEYNEYINTDSATFSYNDEFLYR